jgi:arylsulfatase A-like enzyme
VISTHNYFDAHEPYLPPKPFNQKFGAQMPRKISSIIHRTNSAERPDKWKMTPQEIQAEIDAYDNSIAYLDHHIGLLFDELKRRGILENTLVIVL